jgi:hypothetical protein
MAVNQPENFFEIYYQDNSCYRKQNKGCGQKLLNWFGGDWHYLRTDCASVTTRRALPSQVRSRRVSIA